MSGPLRAVARSPLVRVLALALGLGVAGAALLLHGTKRIEPGEVGVRVRAFGGLERRDLSIGLYRSLPGVDRWHVLSTGPRFVVFGSPDGFFATPLPIRTEDDVLAQVGVTVTWRLVEGRAWRVVAEGLAGAQDARVRAAVEDVLRTELAALSTQDWFESERRGAVLDSARPALAAAFDRVHAELVTVVVHGVAFLPEYEQKLQRKQIEWQLALRAEAQTAVAEATAALQAEDLATKTQLAERRREWSRRRAVEQASSDLAVAEVEGRAARYAAEVRAQADVEHARRVAEGEAALETAAGEAAAERLALLSGPGGDAWLARLAARNLRVDSIVIDSSRPDVPVLLDVDALVDLMTPDGDD